MMSLDREIGTICNVKRTAATTTTKAPPRGGETRIASEMKAGVQCKGLMVKQEHGGEIPLKAFAEHNLSRTWKELAKKQRTFFK